MEKLQMNYRSFLKFNEELIEKTYSTKLVTPKKKKRVYYFQKYKTLRSFRLDISNGTTKLDNAVDDQVYLKDVNDNFKKFTRPRPREKINEKNPTCQTCK